MGTRREFAKRYRYEPIMSSKAAQEDAIHAEAVIQEKPKRRWMSYIWDTLDKSPEERRFLFKLDAALLSFASLGYFIKYLDQVNGRSSQYLNSVAVVLTQPSEQCLRIRNEGRSWIIRQSVELRSDNLDSRIRDRSDS